MSENEFVTNASVSEVGTVEADRAVGETTVTIAYDESAVPTNESDLTIFAWNESIDFFEPVAGASVDADTDTVSATVSGNTTYTVMATSTDFG